MPLYHGLFGWLAIGLVAGALAKLVVPGRDPGGIVVTILIGIAGALLAGYVAVALGWSGVSDGWRAYGAAALGAVLLLALYRLVIVRRTH